MSRRRCSAHVTVITAIHARPEKLPECEGTRTFCWPAAGLSPGQAVTAQGPSPGFLNSARCYLEMLRGPPPAWHTPPAGSPARALLTVSSVESGCSGSVWESDGPELQSGLWHLLLPHLGRMASPLRASGASVEQAGRERSRPHSLFSEQGWCAHWCSLASWNREDELRRCTLLGPTPTS